MAKCLICNSRKGKRQCILKDGSVCSLCCGTTRSKELCEDCSYYQDPKLTRNYKQVPAFTVQMMDDNPDLQTYANAIESALCSVDKFTNEISDKVALRILELLIDKYHFDDPPAKFGDVALENGFREVDKAIIEDIPSEAITKILGVIYRVANRRSCGNREYLDFIHKYVGLRVASGVRALQELPSWS